MIAELTPLEYMERLRRLGPEEPPPALLDVREPWEIAVASLPDALQIPMGEIAAQLDRIPRDRLVVVMCHSGRRSAMVTQFLESQGLRNVANLAGGIDAWSVQIDDSVARY